MNTKISTSVHIPNQMIALRQEAFGPPEVLTPATVPVPTPGISEILVKVEAAGLNPTDWKHRSAERFLGSPPYVLGWDVAGTVVAVGLGVTLFAPGDKVMGMLPYPQGAGSHAEYVVGPTRAFTHKPKNIDMVQAGALPLAALTAWQCLVDTAHLQAGQRVLIHGAAGGVGHLAVQIANSLGAEVTGTASAPKHSTVRELGASHMIDYRNERFEDIAKDMDVVLDTIGGDYQLRSIETLTAGGTLVSTVPVAAPGLQESAQEHGVHAKLILVESDHEGMRRIAELAEAGKLHAVIAETFSLEHAAEAHRLGETNRTTGKIVLIPS